MAQGRRGEREKGTGKTRYEMRVNSKVASTVKEFNDIDMQSLFVYNILTINVPVVGETDNYLVKIKFGGFLDLLHKQIERQDGKLDLRAITRALIDAFNQEDVQISCTCLHPDTKVKLLDGTSPTIEEMYNRFNSGEKLYCYSVDSNGDFVPGEVEKVWITGEASEFIEVTLDNDEVIKTTPDHLYMLRDGSYVQASELYVGQSLMPFRSNHKIKAIKGIVLDAPIKVFDIKMVGEPNFLVDAGVILHNCADFRYRFGFWTTMGNINSGLPERRPSKITNPKNTLGPGCKHIMLVLSNNSWLIKVARVINNWIIYMSKYRQKQYADIVYPAIYGKAYEEPVQLDIDDEQDINDRTSIDTANELGRTRGQFKTGNKYRFQPSNVRRGQVTIDDVEEVTEN